MSLASTKGLDKTQHRYYYVQATTCQASKLKCHVVLEKLYSILCRWYISAYLLYTIHGNKSGGRRHPDFVFNIRHQVPIDASSYILI